MIQTVFDRTKRSKIYAEIMIIMVLAAAVSFQREWLPVAVAFFVLSIVLLSEYIGAIILIIWIATQNTVIPIFYASFGGNTAVWVGALAASELAAVLLVLTSLPKYVAMFSTKRWKWWISSSIIYSFGTLIILFTHRSSGWFSSLYNERMLLIPVLFFALGYSFSKWGKVHGLLRAISLLAIVGASLALVDVLLLGPNFWHALHMGRYWTQIKHLSSADIFRGLPGNFYESYGGVLIRRAVSFYGDPLAAGYSMAIGFGVLLFTLERIEKHRWFWMAGILVVLAGVAVTYTRAAYVMVVVEFASFYFYRRKLGRPVSKFIVLPIIVVFLGIAGKVILSTITLQNGSAQIHLHAFSRVPYMLMHPLGFGVGKTGGPEGTYFQILWQFGLPILLLFIWWLVTSYRCIIGGETLTVYMASGIFLSLVISGVFSQEMLTDTAAGVGWLVIGLAASKTTDEFKSVPSTLSDLGGSSQ